MAKRIKHNERKEIIWNVVNSCLAGFLVLCGAFTSGDITAQGIIAAVAAAVIVALTQFKDFWQKEESEYCGKVFKIF